MAIQKRVRQAGRTFIAHVHRAGGALQRGHARRAGSKAQLARALDERLRTLAAAILAGRYYECAWQTFCFGYLKGLTDEEAVEALAAWCQRHGLAMRFRDRRVRGVGVVLLVLLKPADK
jgi:hypothetical protein